METLLLSREDVESILTMQMALEVVEHAFKLHGLGKTQMPPKVYLYFDKGDLRAMPAYLEGHAGVKWVNSHPFNREKGLPTVMAILIYNDPETGFPLAIMDGTFITNMRTGAAGGIAAKYLARKDSKIIGYIGCGTQARTQFLALIELFDVEEVKCYDINENSAKNFSEFIKGFDIDVRITNAAEACDCDILVTTTPSKKPVVRAEWIKEGTHINAIGADAPGKQEIDGNLLKRAKIVVDDYKQAKHSGEINVPLSQGIITEEDIYASIGEIVSGKKKGRESENEITLFDSTGLAIQDIATASKVYEEAVRRGMGKKFRFFDEIGGSHIRR